MVCFSLYHYLLLLQAIFESCKEQEFENIPQEYSNISPSAIKNVVFTHLWYSYGNTEREARRLPQTNHGRGALMGPK